MVWSAVLAEEKAFSQGLDEADYRAAGLDKLTPEERARLDELVAARVSAQVAAGSAGGVPARAAPLVLRGQIAGTLTGWEPDTVFTLTDGGRWRVVDNSRHRAAPVRRSPKAELHPLANGDYIMVIHTVRQHVQVRRVTETE